MEMKNTIDLLILYIQVNTEVIKHKHTLKMFRNFTEVMKRIEIVLKKIKVKSANKGPF